MVAVLNRLITSSAGFIQETNLKCIDRASEITQGTLLGSLNGSTDGLIIVRHDKHEIFVTRKKQIHINVIGKVEGSDYQMDDLQFIFEISCFLCRKKLFFNVF